jgi:type I restriction enzyme S subunit
VSLDVNKSTWKRVRLGDVVTRSRKQVDPIEEGIERYVAGGHIDSDSITVERWGDPTDGQMGSTFRYVFEPGQILFVSARPYLRKMGVVTFSGVVADKTYVLDASPENGLLQEFLPFVLSSDCFVEYATSEATGSMNPRLLWGPLQRYEFDLPPLDEQKRIADLLWPLERHRRNQLALVGATQALLTRMRGDLFETEHEAIAASKAFEITIGRQRSPRHQEGQHITPYLRSANVTATGIDVSDVKEMNFEPIEQAKFALEPGDVLVSEASASASAVGMPSVWNGELPGVVCFQNTLLRFRAVEGKSLPGFVEQWCRWAFETGRFLAAASGTNIRHVGVRGASSMTVPFPSIERQDEFLRRIAAVAEASSAVAAEFAAIDQLGNALLTEIFGDN